MKSQWGANANEAEGHVGEEKAHGDPWWFAEILFRRWGVISGASVIGAIIGIVWFIQAVPLYTATATLLIDMRRQNIMRAESVVSELAGDQSTVATELALMQSFAVARRVVERLDLLHDPDFYLRPSGPGLVARLKSLVGLESKAQAPDQREESKAGAESEGGPLPDAELPGAVLGAIGAVRGGIQAHRLGAAWLIEVSFIHHNPRVAARLANAIAETYIQEKLEAQYLATKRASAWLRERVDLLRQQVEESERGVTEQRAKYNLAFPVDVERNGAVPRSAAGASKEEAVIRLRDLERQAHADRALYESLLGRLKEAEQQTSLPPAAETRVIAPALEPGAPSFPDKKRNMAIAVLGGIAAGLGLALLLERMQGGYLTVEKLENSLRSSVVATVPAMTLRDRRAGEEILPLPQYLLKKPLSRFSESIRSIRLNVQLASPDVSPRLLMVTSSVPGEGKSTIASCLAHSAAAAGKKVLLVDSDFRHPALSTSHGKQNAPGLTDLLVENEPDGEEYRSEIAPNLWFLPSGTVSAHPPDFIGSERLRVLLQQLSAEYDLVVLDTPPVTPVVDSVLLSALADKIVFVVSWRSTPQYIAERAFSSLDRQKIAAIALNKVEEVKAQRLLNIHGYGYGSYNRYYQ
jgi:capsular exopolysaccharide synthesis family protein